MHALVFTDGVAAELLDDTGAATSVEPGRSSMRFKLPGYERIVDGGLAAVPRLEPAGVDAGAISRSSRRTRPRCQDHAWTIEGRFVAGELAPPADAEPDPGRFDETAPDADAGAFDAAVFAFPPAARVAFEWTPRRPLEGARAARAPRRVAMPSSRRWSTACGKAFSRCGRPASSVALAVDGTIVRGG